MHPFDFLRGVFRLILVYVPRNAAIPLVLLGLAALCFLAIPNFSTEAHRDSAAVSPEISVSPLSVSYGSIHVAGGSSGSFPVTVSNSGPDPLQISQTLTGANPADFSITNSPPATIASGGSTVIQVSFSPTTLGNRTAILRITSDDADEPQTDVALSGTGTANDLVLQSPAAPVNFGSVATGANSSPVIFTLLNSGPSTITLGAPTFGSGSEFSVVSGLGSSTLSPGATTTFSVRFSPLTAGLRTDSVSIQASGDAVPLTISLYGLSTAPEINMRGNGVTISAGDATPSLADHTDFGAAQPGGTTVTRTFAIENIGTADLNISAFNFTGPDAAYFIPSGFPASTLPPNTFTQFDLTFTPDAVRTFSATVSIVSNDADESPYTFSIEGDGTALPPDMDVRGNGVSIADGDATPSLTDHTDFGSSPSDGPYIVRTFTIHNTGQANLNLTASPIVQVLGAHPGNFIVTQQPSDSVVYPGGNTSFQVTFDPTVVGGAGLRTAIIRIPNSDPDEAPYDFAVQAFRGRGNIIVDNITDDISRSSCTDAPAVADCSLRGALLYAGANPESTVGFLSPLFDSPQTIELVEQNPFDPLLGLPSVTINGPGSQLLTIDGNSQNIVFQVQSTSTVVLKGLKITGGNHGDEYGAGVTNLGNLTIDSCHITGNSGGRGGGVYTEGPSLAVVNTTISNNGSGFGVRGGGIYAVAGTTTVTNSTISGNTTSALLIAQSGGILVENSTLLISNSTVVNNTAAFGTNGSGIMAVNSNVTVRSSILAASLADSHPDIRSTGGTLTSSGYNLIGDVGPVTAFTQPGDQSGSTASPLDPMLGILENNGGTAPTHLPLAGSPVIDKGSSFGLTLDQRGMPRTYDFASIANAVSGDGTDIGAVEVMAPTAADASISGRVTTVYGTAIRGVAVTVLDMDGGASTTMYTNTFGYYSFRGLQAGQTYIVSVKARRYQFETPTQVVNLLDNVGGLNFVGSP